MSGGGVLGLVGGEKRNVISPSSDLARRWLLVGLFGSR